MDNEKKSNKMTVMSLTLLLGTIGAMLISACVVYLIDDSAAAIVSLVLTGIAMVLQLGSIITGIIGFVKKRTMLSIVMFGISMISVFEMGGFVILFLV